VSVSATGCGKGSKKNVKIPGVSGPFVNIVDNKLTMSLTFTEIQFDEGIRLEIPKMPNSYVEVGPDFQSAGYLLSVGLDVNDIKTLTHDGFDVLDPHSLPGGRPLPGVVEGQLPGVAVQIPKLKDVVFYVGPQVFGAFVPVKLPIKTAIVTHRFYDGAGDQVGNISVVGTDAQNDNSGFLLLINLAGKVGKLLALN
jgi:hypothetical protein